MNINDPYTIIGIVGMLLVLLGIWRTSTGFWTSKSFLYELDTIIGASLLIIYQLHYKAYVALPINVILVYISFRGLSSHAERFAARELKRSRKRRSRK
jgi:hypothetical protein